MLEVTVEIIVYKGVCKMLKRSGIFLSHTKTETRTWITDVNSPPDELHFLSFWEEIFMLWMV